MTDAGGAERVVIVVELTAYTYGDMEQTVAAIREALAASPVAERVKMTANLKDVAERVLKAMEPQP